LRAGTSAASVALLDGAGTTTVETAALAGLGEDARITLRSTRAALALRREDLSTLGKDDIVEVEIDGVGTLRNRVAEAT
jgi:2-keto-4-pentenoate hydratase/2-oxohepta-3-ene-1,7-dioic acid hydratase in catechol pathway